MSRLGAPTQSTCNETGCICRGATLAQLVDVSGLASDSGDQWFESSVATLTGEMASSSLETLWPQRESRVGRIFGRQLRAQYASLVI